MVDPDVLKFIFLFAGIIISFALLSLLVHTFSKDSKLYLRFGIMGICVSVYILLIPFMDNRDFGESIFKIALSFYIISFAILPWFICSYTGYCKRNVQLLISSILIVTLVLLLFAKIEVFGLRLWNIIGHIGLLSIGFFGLTASLYQRKQGDKKASNVMFIVIIIFGLLTIDDIFRMYFGAYYIIPSTPILLPLDYFLFMFILIIGLKFVNDLREKNILEKKLVDKEMKWSSLLNNVNLLIFDCNTKNEIEYVNPYFLKFTGYSEDDLIGESIERIIVNPDEWEDLLRASVQKSSHDKLRFFRTKICCKDSSTVIINWSVIGIYDEHGIRVNSMLIGTDISEELKAYDEISKLKALLEEEILVLKSEIGQKPSSKNIVGSSDAIQYVLERSRQVAETDATVLIEGETGVGKELIANFIQRNSKRSEKPYIKINCSAIPSTLLESELFGYEKGAFTGADRKKKGMVELADKGTLFLDEIGEFPIELQPKLLRFLQEGEFMPLGSEKAHKSDVRIIAATNKNLLDEIEKGTFRNDLYYRLYVYPITISPLRKRQEDIPELSDVFIRKYSAKHNKPVSKISKPAINKLMDYTWPGNIRELENIIEQAVIICMQDVIKSNHINIGQNNEMDDFRYKDFPTLKELEIKYIQEVLLKTEGKISGKNGAADILGMNPNTLRSRISKLGIVK